MLATATTAAGAACALLRIAEIASAEAARAPVGDSLIGDARLCLEGLNSLLEGFQPAWERAIRRTPPPPASGMAGHPLAAANAMDVALHAEGVALFEKEHAALAKQGLLQQLVVEGKAAKVARDTRDVLKGRPRGEIP